MELFNQAKRKRNIDRKDLDKDEAELQKNPDEFTFQPNSHKRAGNQTQRGASPQVRREEVGVPGYARPRGQTRERSQPAPVGGALNVAYNSNTTASSQQQTLRAKGKKGQKQLIGADLEESDHNGEEPLLYVDVNLGEANGKTRIALYQNSNPEKVARRFVAQNGLDEHILENLISLLKEQLQKALTNIYEEEEHSDDNNQ